MFVYFEQKYNKILTFCVSFIFLGSRYRVINNKTIVSISSNKKRRIRRNIKNKKYLYNMGYISYKSYYSSINSYNKINKK